MKAPRIDLLAYYSSPYSIYYIVQITQCKKSKVTYLKFAITPCPRYYWRGRMDQGLCNYMNQKDISAPRDSSRSKEAIRTWLRLMSCETVIEQQLRSLFRTNFSVTLPQFDVLSELERSARKMTMSELSRELMVSNGNVTGVIDRLEKNGFVTRTRAEHDRRIQYIELTPMGRSEFNEMARSHESWLDKMFSDLSPDDMASLQTLLLKARSSVGT